MGNGPAIPPGAGLRISSDGLSINAPGGKQYDAKLKTMRAVATHSRSPWFNYNTFKQAMSVSTHIAEVDFDVISYGLPNWYGDASGLETTSGLSDITYTTSVEYIPANGSTAASLVQGKFGGATSGLCTVGSTLYPDPIQLPITIRKGQHFRIRIWGSSATGMLRVPINNTCRQAFGGPTDNIYKASTTTVADETMSATITPITSGGYPLDYWSFCPVVIIGMSSNPAIAIIGDSRAQAMNNRATLPLDADSLNGQAEVVVGQMGAAWFNLSQYSDRMDHFTLALAPRRLALAQQWATHIYLQLGINDTSNGATLTNMKDRAQAIKNLLPGKVFIMPTLPPTVTGTTANADGSDQTIGTNNAVRVSWNEALRGGDTCADHVVEVADLIESGRNSGKFKCGYRTVTDGAYTINTNTISSTTASFTSADIGKCVNMVNGGKGGAPTPLVALILGISGNVATINCNIGKSQAGTDAIWIGDVWTIDNVHETVLAQKYIKDNVKITFKLQ